MTTIDMSGLRGAVTLPDDEGFAEKSSAHQLAVTQRPEAVIEAASVDELRSALTAARGSGLTVATQAGGHGASEDLAGSLLVRLPGFDRIEVDEAAGTAIVGAGVRAGDLLARLTGTGLVPAVGTSHDVTLVPLLLGGGLGWTARAVGLSAQTVRRVEILLPDGSHGWVDDETDPDLMRVLRGAGGLVGVVTAVEVDLMRATGLAGGNLSYAVADGGAAWRAVRDAELQDALTVMVASMRIPDLPFLPEAIRGRSWFGISVLALDGDLTALEAARAAAEPVADDLGPIDVADIPLITNDPREASASAFTACLLGDLPDEAIDAVLAWHATDVGAAVVALGARRLGGVLDRPSKGAVADLSHAAWIVTAVLPIAPGSDGSHERAAAAALRDVLEPWAVPGNVPTFLSTHQRLDAALDAEAIALVHSVRERLDAGVLRPTRL